MNNDDYNSPNSNNTDAPFPQVHGQKYGYNELENRQMDLCLLTSEGCNDGSGGVFSLVATISFIPLPLNGH